MWRVTMGAGIVFAGMTLSAAPADADPIQVVYRIDILRQCEYSGGMETCRGFTASFPLTLSFDSQITTSHGNEMDRTNFYGPPTFSDIPLPRSEDFPPMVETFRLAAERAQVFPGDSAFTREASAMIRHTGARGGSDYHWDFGLFASGGYPAMPTLDAHTFATFLATAPFRQFYLGDTVELADGGFQALTYFGSVSLESQAPVPEPASVLLLATGLAGIGVRRWRRGRNAETIARTATMSAAIGAPQRPSSSGS
jgi:hypothetical protein